MSYPANQGEVAAEDMEDSVVVKSTDSRVLRGGSFALHPANVRSSNRDGNVPTFRSLTFGFRLARTLPLSTFTALPLPAEGAAK